MKTTLSLLLGAYASMASAQLVNGGFEDGLNGWQEFLSYPDGMTGPIALIADVPSGGGVHSLAVPMPTEEVATVHQVFQPLPPIPTGTSVLISGWMRSGFSGPWYASPSIALCTCDSNGFATPIAPPLVHQGGSAWAYEQGSVMVSSAPPDGSVHCIGLDSGLNPTQLQQTALFDQIFMQLDPSTGPPDLAFPDQPGFRPNPATDKLWVDLPDAPISVTAIDATGRTHALQNFQHRDRTLELDVSTLPSGVNMVRILLPSGNLTIRFIKT